MSKKRALAIDLGASSGRGIIGTLEDGKIRLEEIHRFSNDPVSVSGHFYWDTLRLLFEIKAAILKASASGGVDTVGIDTWGVDYGYIDAAGQLLSVPCHYRDERTAPAMERVYGKISYGELYRICGIESMSFNTVFQIDADLHDRPWLVENAKSLLFTPDLLGYFLTGKRACEYSIATTSSLVDAKTGEFSKEVLDRLGIPSELFEKIVMPGNILGTLTPEVDEETGHTGTSVVNIASHDTSSAVLAVPARSDDFLFISSGTWSLMGTENESPIIGELSAKYGFTNEGGVGGRVNVMKNIMGLWLIQESRRQWKREGKDFSFADLEKLASECEPHRYFIDPDDPAFSPAGDIPTRIGDYCERTGQGRPATVGETVRCIYESLCLKYRRTAEMLEDLCQKNYREINIVGGGTKDKLLCRYTADCTGKTVTAGPVEATAIGNIAMQLIASGEIEDVKSARETVRRSFDVVTYEPNGAEKAAWDRQYERFLSTVS